MLDSRIGPEICQSRQPAAACLTPRSAVGASGRPGRSGPAYSTTTLSWYIYVQAFQWLHMGFGCALAYVLFFIIMVLTLIQFRLQRRWVFYG